MKTSARLAQIIIALNFLFLAPAGAFYSTVDNGDILKDDEYKLTLAPQVILSNGSGMNMTTHFETGISDSSAFRVVLGAGDTDFHTGAFFKWIPIPDLEGQPAIGLRVGAIWFREANKAGISSRLHPLVSKKFSIKWGELNSYASIPIGITAYDGESTVPIQLAVGAELKTFNYENINFGAELGFDLDQAFSYMNIFVSLYFDDKEGVKLQ